MLQGMRQRQKEAEEAERREERNRLDGREKNEIEKGEPSKRRGRLSTQRRRTGRGKRLIALYLWG